MKLSKFRRGNVRLNVENVHFMTNVYEHIKKLSPLGDTHEQVAVFKKSSHSGQGNCVEVRIGVDDVEVRDSKHPDAGLLFWNLPAWQDFILSVKKGEFDIPK